MAPRQAYLQPFSYAACPSLLHKSQDHPSSVILQVLIMSCEKCTNIVFRPWNKLNADEAQRIRRPDTLDQDDEDTNRWSHFICIHETILDLQRSNEHCHLCRKMFVAFQRVASAGDAVNGRKNIGDQYRLPVVYLTTAMREQVPLADNWEDMAVWAYCGSIMTRLDLLARQGTGKSSDLYHEWPRRSSLAISWDVLIVTTRLPAS